MQTESDSQFSVEQRLAVYRAARDTYAKDHTNPRAEDFFNISGERACLGMCRLIRKAIRTVADRNGVLSLNRVNFPEYFSYKPKTTWKKSPGFWWTISVKNGGAKKRMEVLDRLAKGLSKGE
jgi:hypothetical protein